MITRLLLILFLSLTLSAKVLNSNIFVYHCENDYDFVAEINKNEAWLFLPSKTVKAKQVSSVEGSKYRVNEILYWYKRDEARLKIGTKKFHCKNDSVAAAFEKAKFEGVAFRAIGNQPDWILEITADEKVVLITNHGESKIAFKVLEKFSDNVSTEYKLVSTYNTMYIRIENRVCNDTMVDRIYDSTVYINFDGVNMQGCGKSLF